LGPVNLFKTLSIIYVSVLTVVAQAGALPPAPQLADIYVVAGGNAENVVVLTPLTASWVL
jgi:hypothetical protein